MRFLPSLALAAVLSGPVQALAQAGPAKPRAAPEKPMAGAAYDTLDHSRVHGEYGDGNFEVVIQMLEAYRNSHKDFRRGDSLLIAKYLGVVYASNPVSREKGKYWLYRMLQIDPRADLVDMYVGDEVDRTFEKVRQEFIVRRNYRGINDVNLSKAVQDGERRDTVVVRDTVRVGHDDKDSLPQRQLKDFRHGWTGNLNLGLGLKLMDEEDWAGTSQQTEFRIALDLRQKRWPINIAFDYMYSTSENAYIESDDGTITGYRQFSNEVYAGVRKIFDQKLYSMRPFVGGGFGYISTGVTIQNFNRGTLGAWLDGGIYWELERHFNIGAEFIWSWAKVPYAISRVTNAGGAHVEMLLGYHW